MLAATNRPELIDPALLRAGRFDLQVELPAPDAQARREILAIHSRDMPLSGDVDLEGMAARTEGLVGSDIEALCRRASMLAVRECVHAQRPDAAPSSASTLEVRGHHFEEALRQMGREPR